MRDFRLSHVLPALALLGAVLATAAPARANGFTSYVIRDASGGGPAPVIHLNTPAAGQTQFLVNQSGQKAALGSNDLNGLHMWQIGTLAITRFDDPSRFTPGSGPAFAPYLNFWITDGTHFAVVANEPTNPGFQPLYHNGYDLSFADLSDKVANIYETSDKSWLPNNGVGLHFSDLASFVIMAPTIAQIVGQPGITSGAPRELGTNIAYGTNWVFGDTAANYVGDTTGYVVGDAVAKVPEPATMALLGAGLLGLGVVRRRRRG